MSRSSHPVFQAVVPTTPVIPASGSNPTEIISALTEDVKAIDIQWSGTAAVDLYQGADSSLKKVMTIGGIVTSGINTIPRASVMLSKGTRLSVRANANTTIAAGTFIINGWV